MSEYITVNVLKHHQDMKVQSLQTYYNVGVHRVLEILQLFYKQITPIEVTVFE